ncbi:MAG: hypothetical protein ACRDKG_09155 [Actinomycetota bacterium]
MDFRRNLDLIGVILIAAGFGFVIAGWVGLRGQDSVVEQIPYLASGGIGGLALIGTGAFLLHMTRQARIDREVKELGDRQRSLESTIDLLVAALSENSKLKVSLSAAQSARRRNANGGSLPKLRDASDEAREPEPVGPAAEDR